MSSAFGGIALLASAAVLTGAAAVASRRGYQGLALSLLVMMGVGLRVHAAADRYLHPWDERYHAVVGKNLRAHPLKPTLYEDPVLTYDPRDWLTGHVWLHKPPLALWTIAASLGAFGINEWAVRLPSLLASALAIALTYRLARLLGLSPPGGLLAAFLHAVNGFSIDLAAGRRPTDHVDALFVTLVEIGIVLALAAGRSGPPTLWAAAGVGAVTGLAILTKWLPALLVLGVMGLFVALRDGVRRAAPPVVAAAACAAAVALPWNLYARAAYPVEHAFERAYDLQHLFVALEGHTGDLWTHVLWMPRFFGELVFLPVAWWLQSAARRRDPLRLAVAAWILVPYAIFSLVATKMPGYVMIAAPAVFLAVAEMAVTLQAAAVTGARRLLALLVVLLLVGLPVRYAVERLRPFAEADREPAWAADLKALGARVNAPCVVFAEPRPIEALFYTPCSAYPFPPTEAQIEELVRRGYRIVVRAAPGTVSSWSAGSDVEVMPLSP